MIHTITHYLYEIHRDRVQLQIQIDKRKAAFLTLSIFAIVSAGVILYIVQ